MKTEKKEIQRHEVQFTGYIELHRSATRKILTYVMLALVVSMFAVAIVDFYVSEYSYLLGRVLLGTYVFYNAMWLFGRLLNFLPAHMVLPMSHQKVKNNLESVASSLWRNGAKRTDKALAVFLAAMVLAVVIEYRMTGTVGWVVPTCGLMLIGLTVADGLLLAYRIRHDLYGTHEIELLEVLSYLENERNKGGTPTGKRDFICEKDLAELRGKISELAEVQP